MAKKPTLIPLKPRIDEHAKRYEKLEAFIRNRLFGFLEYTPEKAKKLKREIFRKLDEQDQKNELWVARYIYSAYRESARYSKAKLESLGVKPKKSVKIREKKTLKKGMKRTNEKLDFINDQIRARTTTYFQELKRSYRRLNIQNLSDSWSQEIRKDVEEIRKESLKPKLMVTRAGFEYLATPSRGEIQKQIKKSFEKHYGDFDFIEITMKNGKVRKYNPDKYFKMVARTEGKQVQAEAVLDKCAQYKSDLVFFPAHSNPCPLCAPFQGQIFSISGNDKNYPPLDEAPPLHPNCEDVMSPITQESIDFTKKRAKKYGLPEPFPKPRFDLKVADIQESLKTKRAA
jgi:hypothetical protein